MLILTGARRNDVLGAKWCDIDFQNRIFNPATMQPYVNIFHAWNRVRKAAGIEDVRLHDLRHSYASFLVNQGRSIYEVQKILGHLNVKTTQRYAHLSNDTLLAATNSVSDYVSNVSGRVLDRRMKSIAATFPSVEMRNADFLP